MDNPEPTLEEIQELITALECDGSLFADTDWIGDDVDYTGDVCYHTGEEDEDGEPIYAVMATFEESDDAWMFVRLVEGAKWMLQQLKQRV